MDYDIKIFDYQYSIFNFTRPIFYLLEHKIIKSIGMGFKVDQALALLPLMKNYDVLITSADSAGLPILALKKYRLLNKPVVYITSGLAGALINKKNTYIYKFYRDLLGQANVLVCYSQVEKEFFIKYTNLKKSQLKFVSLGVDYEYFRPKKNIKKDIICAVGLDSCRDYKTLFEAVKDLNIKVEIVCHTENIKNLSVPKNVKVHTLISISEVRKIYQRSIISVIPSYEKFRSTGQIVYLESASAHIPIIATKVKGLSTAFELKDNVHLLYSKEQDAQDLKEKISLLLNSPQKRKYLAAEAANLVKNNYTSKHLAKNLANIIEKL
jgi:glycosyltransferase involved in cell wall biosynthesis